MWIYGWDRLQKISNAPQNLCPIREAIINHNYYNLSMYINFKICVVFILFLSVCTISTKYNASIFYFSHFFGGKKTLIGSLKRSKLKIPSRF